MYLLFACCSKEKADWCRSEILGWDWPGAKDRFLRHFVSANLKSAYLAAYESISMKPDEPPTKFADRYVSAMRLAGISPSSLELDHHFLSWLPADILKSAEVLCMCES